MSIYVDPLMAFYIGGAILLLVIVLIALPTLLDQLKKK